MNKRVLMIAYHFPPIKGSSGIQRTLKFCQYLPQFGWQPSVLTTNERAYETVSQEQMHQIANGTVVTRAFALDTSRHLSICGRYSRFLALPDRWASWLVGGIFSGLRLIVQQKPHIIWSTYPIATAHLIAYALHKMTGLPWVADMRDPMAQDNYPEDPLQHRVFRWIENKIALKASAICFTSPGAIDEFIKKHEGLIDPKRIVLLENGYDEDCFKAAEKLAQQLPSRNKRPLTLLHSGIIYPSERDPRPFLQAVAQLKKSGVIDSQSVNIIFRASGHDNYLEPLLKSMDVDDIICLEPPLPYVEALAEMLTVDALLLFQSASCNYQIPAKLYEYLRAGRPILGITDASGDTAKIVGRYRINRLADSASYEEITTVLAEFIGQLRLPGPETKVDPPLIIFSRFEKTRELAGIFNSLVP